MSESTSIVPPSSDEWIHSPTIQVINLLGIIFAIILGTLIVTLYTSTRTMPVFDETQGTRRLEVLMQLLQLHFGTSWPYAFLGFALVLLFFALAIFWKSREGAGMEIYVDPSSASQGLIVMVCIFILLSIGLIGIFVHTFLTLPANEYATEAELTKQQEKKQSIVYGVAAALVLLFGGTMMVGFFRRKMT